MEKGAEEGKKRTYIQKNTRGYLSKPLLDKTNIITVQTKDQRLDAPIRDKY